MTVTIPLISRDLSAGIGGWQEALQAAMPEYLILPLEELDDEQRSAATVAVVADPEPSVLAGLPNLIWIHSLWAGVERLVQELPTSSDLKIVRLEDPQMARTMAEAVLSCTLYLHRDMPLYRQQQQNKVWKAHALPLPSERNVCILGLGNLGRAAANALKDSGFSVSGWSRSGQKIDGVDVYSGKQGFEQALAAADIAVILMPLTGETRGMIDADALAVMKAGSSMINFARGPIVDDDALLNALDRGHIKHAVLDVFSVEPLPQESPYWLHPSATVLPHISAPTNRKTASHLVAVNIHEFFRSGRIPRTVDRARGY